jgi:lipid II:glycine glycyltransferase (peptidoglycan interpeptide bridge formation enzyme)
MRNKLIEIEKRRYAFRIKEVWFSDSLFDEPGKFSQLAFRRCKLHKKPSGFNCIEEITSVIDLHQDLDTIWGKMKKDSCRNSIRRAEKAGVNIRLNRDFDEFYMIYNDHVKSKKYFRTVEDKRLLEKCGPLFVSEYDGEILGGHLYIEDQDHILYYRGATKTISDNKELNTIKGNASRLLHWEAIKYAKEKGIKKFDFGGLFTDSINAMKESFGGERTSYYAYWKDYDLLFKTCVTAGKFLSNYRLI